LRLKFVGDKPDASLIVIKNADTTKISAGQPVCFDTRSIGANPDSYVGGIHPASNGVGMRDIAGVAVEDIKVGEAGHVMVYGYCRNISILAGTRAASTDPFPSASAVPLNGAPLTITGNGFAAAANTAGWPASTVYAGVIGFGQTPTLPLLLSSPANTSLERYAPAQGFVRLL